MISTRAADMAKKGRLHPVLEEAVDALGISGQVPALRSAARLSQSLVEDARSFLQKEVRPSKHTPIDVLVFGSIARQEATHESDFDYLVVAHGLPKRVTLTRELLAAAEQTRERLDLKRPGAAGMFGRVIAAADLTERIGLEQDTNANHSHRILILEESVSVYQPRLRKTLIQAILARYLADYEQPKLGVPRFLLNDVLRYWRTLAVDYQAKRWEQVAPDWGLRP
jgi:predicted nucleotidyltransferase